MLQEDVAAVIAINGTCKAFFFIWQGVRQECPFAPYLFLSMAEALAIKQTLVCGDLPRITLLEGSTKQTLTQYIVDATFSFFGQKRCL